MIVQIQFIYIQIDLILMKESYVEIILVFVLVAEVLFLILYDHNYFAVYIDIVVLCLFITASYLAYRYFQITKKMPVRVTEMKTMEDYQFLVEKSRRSQTDKLLKSKQMKDLQKMKLSRQTQVQKNDEEMDSFLAELQQKEEEIFNFSQ